MEPKSYFKSTCTHCGGRIEAPAEGVGIWVHCPHCGEKTQLAATNPEPPAPPKKSKGWAWILLCGFVLVAIAAGVFVWHRAQMPASVQVASKVAFQTTAPAPQPERDLWKGLKPGPVTIEKAPNSRLAYATVTVRNDTDKQRYGVKVTLDVFDPKGEKLGTATDYAQFIDAHKDWSFKALVAFPKATTAKITEISEE
jgi:rRNA maturation protein Nop10